MKIFMHLMIRIERWLEKFPQPSRNILYWLIFKPVLFLSCMYYLTNSNSLVCHCRDRSSKDYLRFTLKVLLTPLYIIRYFFHGRVTTEGRDGLAFVLIAKNEASYIEEWLNFHIKQGVSHFIIYDNESTDNFHEVLMPYIESGLVSYETIPGKKRQHDAYNLALKKYGRKFKYMGFIDADEFVFVRDAKYKESTGSLYRFVDDFMTTHKNAGGIGINWLIFGSSHHEKRPEGGVLENFTMCAERDFFENRNIKTICDPLKAMSYILHMPIYYFGWHNLDENGEIIYSGNRTEHVHFDKIRINHYFTKSNEEFISKRKRGRATSDSLRAMDDFQYFDKNAGLDTEILSHI